MDAERFARQTALSEIGPEGQRRLAAASVLIVGLGGLGAPAALYLACAGVGRLGLCDPDTVGLSNLHRQVLYANSDLGRPKAGCAAAALAARSAGYVRLDVIPQGLAAENADAVISSYDIVVDCTDNYRTRYLIDEVCAAQGKPWVHGSIGSFAGRVAVFNGPGRRRRYTDLYPDREALEALPPASGGVLGALPGVVGALEAAEAVKLICGFGTPADGRLFTIDLSNLSTQIFEF